MTKSQLGYFSNMKRRVVARELYLNVSSSNSDSKTGPSGIL